MAKTSITFLCRECGGESLRWSGQCPHCRAWNTLEEFTVRHGRGATRSADRRNAGANGANGANGVNGSAAQPITKVDTTDAPRLRLEWEELNRVLGGGFVTGSLVLISGEPGVGKSTLLMQVSEQVARGHGPVLYASGEESPQQIKMRAERLGALDERLLVLSDNDLDHILDEIARTRPTVAVVDSIQTVSDAALDGAAGTVTQVREATARLQRLAKESGVTVVLVGHVTKDGAIAGPRVLEHMVDTVLYLEGERREGTRILRANKNRFGSTEEIGMFAMGGVGLAEVADPGALLIDRPTLGFPGTAAVPIIEGTRPLLVELQSLVVPAPYGMPRRTASGYDLTRLHVLVAIVEKRGRIRLSQSDVFVNVAGGMRISDTAADLGLALSIAGNARNGALPDGTVVLGELGLTGEVRAVPQIDRRLVEAARRGFARAIIPRLASGTTGSTASARPPGIELVEVEDLSEAIDFAYGRDRGGRGAGGPVLTMSGGEERR